MKNLLIALMLALPGLAVVGCQQDSATQSEVANLKVRVATLEDENSRLRGEATGVEGEGNPVGDFGALLTRLERQERELTEANKRLSELEGKPVATIQPAGEKVEGEVSYSEDELSKFRKMEEVLRAERDAARQAEREKRQAEQMAEGKRLAEKYGFEFDENDPRGSIMKIMSDPAQRAKAMEAMRTEMTERRLEPLKLDEFQKKEVLRIEEDTRNKIRDAANAARENGATQEEIQQQVKTLQDDQKKQMEGVLTPEQMKQYEESGAGMGGMIPGFGGGGGWGGMIPGGGGGWGGGGNGGGR